MQGHPIHLWDALSGQLRASYRVYDAADEVTAACSVAFDTQGQRLIAGLNNRLCIFDVARPGRYCKNIVPHSRASPGLQGARFVLLLASCCKLLLRATWMCRLYQAPLQANALSGQSINCMSGNQEYACLACPSIQGIPSLLL